MNHLTGLVSRHTCNTILPRSGHHPVRVSTSFSLFCDCVRLSLIIMLSVSIDTIMLGDDSCGRYADIIVSPVSREVLFFACKSRPTNLYIRYLYHIYILWLIRSSRHPYTTPMPKCIWAIYIPLSSLMSMRDTRDRSEMM
jgi:hypothetical protein